MAEHGNGSKKEARLDRIDEKLVDRAVAELRQIVVGGGVELTVRVGEYLIEHFYGGAQQARSHEPNKTASLRRLAERAEEFGMTPAGVTRSVPLAIQARQLGRPLALRLGVRQHRLLLPVRDVNEKKLLAEAAVDAGWSADELRTKIPQLHKRHPGGRPKQPALRVFVARAARTIEDVDFAKLRRGIENIPPGERRHLRARIAAMRAALERAEKLLG